MEEDRQAQALRQQTGLSDLVCRALARRNIVPEFASAYLNPKIEDLMPDPSELKDMDLAAERFAAAMANQERIAIFADYDVDGGSSAAMIISWLRKFNITPTLYVPHRITEGYGPSSKAMSELSRSHDLIICVDCGTAAHDPIAVSKADVIVLDHHLCLDTLPPALAVVNPCRNDDLSELNNLCAAGVVFMFLVAVNRLTRDRRGCGNPALFGMLDLVALATVADVVPLTGLNRALVCRGIEVMRRRERAGLRALSDLQNLSGPPDTYHLGFVFGPRINASGRIGDPRLGARLLATADGNEARALAEQLETLNRQRRELVDQIYSDALDQASGRDVRAPLVWAASTGWHPGVAGIVASRVAETFNRPAIILGISGDSARGSGRSVAGIDLGRAVSQAAQEGLLTGGGHTMAVGMNLDSRGVNSAMERICELLFHQGAHELERPHVRVDGQVQPSGITTDLIEDLSRTGPFGAGSPAPKFVLPNLFVKFRKQVGDRHLKLAFEDGSGGKIEALAFSVLGEPLGEFLQTSPKRLLHVAGNLEVDRWGGRKKPLLKLLDAAPVQPDGTVAG